MKANERHVYLYQYMHIVVQDGGHITKNDFEKEHLLQEILAIAQMVMSRGVR